MPSAGFYSFGMYRMQFPAGLLYRGDEIAPLPPKAAQVLLVLLENCGEVVSKADLLNSAWQNAVVEEGSLTRTISVLRKVLGTDSDGTDYIATISKRGYRLTVPIRVSDKPVREAKEKVLLVVLPFENFSPDPGQEYFSEGLTEEMITHLSRLNPERLGVIARTSAMMFKGTNKRIADIGSELGVHYVLEGSVRRAGSQMRISAQLIRVDDEIHVWAESYARSLGDVLKLQSEVARSIAAEIRVKLTPRGERTLRQASGVAPEAYEAYLRGRHSWNKRTEEGMRQSIVHYQHAIHLCPEYSSAHAGVADSYVMLACRGMVSAKETFRKAKTAARKAIELDEDLGVAHASLAHVRLHDWDWEGLEKDFQHALELDPSQGIAYYWFGEYLMTMGRPEEAIAITREAHRMDPLSPVIGSSLAMILYLARKYDRALETLERAREIHPEHFLPHMRMGLILTQKGDHNKALAELTTAVALSNKSTETLAALAAGFAAAGNIKQAENLTTHLQSLQGQRYVLPYNIAKIHAAACNKEMAFYWLEKAYDEGNPDLIELNSEPIFDNIRADSRLSDLMSRVGWNA